MESESVLQIRRTFAAPASKVYQAWTQKDGISQWFAPGKDFKTIIHELDVRPGGRYRVEMQSPDGKNHIVAGTYREVQPPDRLVFSWSWETEPQHGETEVTLEFASAQKGTELTLTQRFFPTRSARDEHNKGWDGCLNRLEEFVA
jgi:uncharacterized protein YndB with AHSA1/START domain